MFSYTTFANVVTRINPQPGSTINKVLFGVCVGEGEEQDGVEEVCECKCSCRGVCVLVGSACGLVPQWACCRGGSC